MGNLNEVTLIGRLGAEPKMIEKKDKTIVMECQIATNEYWKPREKVHTHTEWHTVEIKGAYVDFILIHCDVGDEFFIRGRLRTRKWKNNEGKNRAKTIIMAYELQLLRRKGDCPKHVDDDTCYKLMKQYSRREGEPSSHDKFVEAFKEDRG